MTLAKLTIHFGESDRVHGHLLADELMRLCADARVHASVLLRASEGFGAKHQLHTDRLLTLSEDLPLAVVAIDEREAVHALAERVAPVAGAGLVTLESASPAASFAHEDDVKLSLLASRRERTETLVDRLHRAGMDAAVVLLGVDGTVGGERRRAGFFSRNADVPALVVATGPAAAARSALAALEDRFAAIERVVVCKRDGALLADPRREAPDGWWQRVSIHTREDARHEGHPLHLALIRTLRREGAAGATALRGVYGYSGGAAPHGDRFFALRRTVPVLTVVVDRPQSVARWWPAIDELTDRAGVVTSELVPDVRGQASPR